MKVCYFILLFIILCGLKLNAQNPFEIDSVSYSYFNGITRHKQIINNFRIINRSNEEYLTWISLIPTHNKTNAELIYDFFRKRKGDFSFIDIMNEDLLYNSINIGFTFMKRILPNEEFSYYIAKTDSISTFYQDRIVVINKNEVEHHLKMEIKENYFFPFSSIFLIENNF